MIEPVCVIPVFPPAAAFMAVTVISPPPPLIVIAPKETIVDAAPPVAETVSRLAVISPVDVITVADAVEVDCVLVILTTPPVIAPV